jgi:hypothetical protein
MVAAWPGTAVGVVGCAGVVVAVAVTDSFCSTSAVYASMSAASVADSDTSPSDLPPLPPPPPPTLPAR